MSIVVVSCQFFHDMISTKNLDLNNIKIDEGSYKNVHIYHIGYVTPNSAKPLHLIISNTKGYIKESNGNKHLTPVNTDESTHILEKYMQTDKEEKQIKKKYMKEYKRLFQKCVEKH